MEKEAHDRGKGSKLRKIIRTLSRCRTLTGRSKSSTSSIPFVPMSKSKSWPRRSSESEEQEKPSTKSRVAPEGCFSVYVGPEKERFVIKTEYANHPLFKILLEEAEMEYGFDTQGPLALPCEVDIFHSVLWEMDNEDETRGCGLAKGYSAYRPLTPARV
ncbi:auxin-responsive protein SAUR72-like [Aristolochia californica]|uniref:auxin-responsive protein SAUR72-like n=1 Tax=Aristolochia californica TaxID=171875 RepID=UPI0035E28B5F